MHSGLGNEPLFPEDPLDVSLQAQRFGWTSSPAKPAGVLPALQPCGGYQCHHHASCSRYPGFRKVGSGQVLLDQQDKKECFSEMSIVQVSLLL